ncbi:hypothetical protein QTP88_028625 [Uroleucon formosanum]
MTKIIFEYLKECENVPSTRVNVSSNSVNHKDFHMHTSLSKHIVDKSLVIDIGVSINTYHFKRHPEFDWSVVVYDYGRHFHFLLRGVV